MRCHGYLCRPDRNRRYRRRDPCRQRSRSAALGFAHPAWTMDYRTNRVNVRYDGQLITEITCG